MKTIRNTFYLFAVAVLMMSACKDYKNSSMPVEERVKSLLSKMTLDEKLLMLSGDTSGFDTKEIKRLEIPAIHVTDGPLGVRFGKATSFPAGTAMAATWDTSLINEVAAAMAKETRAKSRDYLLGPCVCIHRFPYGGRNFESYSEDPFLASRMAVNWVKGLQGGKVIASVKHFAMNDQEWERNRYNVVIDERTMREIHLPAFEAAVKEGGAWSVMSAYNVVNGQHCSENYHLLNDILKGDWGFQGFVVSDWVSVYSTENAANAGLDLEMPIPAYFAVDSLKKAIADGKVKEEVINDKVIRLLRAMFSVGLFDKRPEPDTSVLKGEAHKKLALKAGQEAIVLLKNDQKILPLDASKIKTIAVIGPNAKLCRTNGGGSSYVQPYYSVSPLEGITKRVGDKVKVVFAQGDIYDIPEVNPIKEQFLFTPDKKENGLKAEYFNNDNLKGNPVATKTEKSINFQWDSKTPVPELGFNNYSIRLSGYIKPEKTKECDIYTISDDGIRMFLDDKKVIDNWSDHGAVFDKSTIKIQAGKEIKIVIEYYQHSGDAQLKLGWTYDMPALKKTPLQEAVEIAKSSDVAIIFAGLSNNVESEGLDPATNELPGKQKELIAAVAKANPNTIVVLNGGIALKVEPWLKDIKGLLDMFYLGQETGNAIASVLFGDINPSGKLPFSFIKGPEQSPACKDYKNPSLQIKYDEGVFIGYRYLDKNKLEPVFPFGYGLSYTTFEYSNIKVKDLGSKNFEVSIDIKNTGSVKGNEVAQLYVSEKVCSVPRPVKELKGFSKIFLDAGETKTISMKLKERDFAFWDVTTKNWKVEPGDFDILVGSSSRDIKLMQTVIIK